MSSSQTLNPEHIQCVVREVRQKKLRRALARLHGRNCGRVLQRGRLWEGVAEREVARGSCGQGGCGRELQTGRLAELVPPG